MTTLKLISRGTFAGDTSLVFASIWIQICKGKMRKKVYDKIEKKKEVKFDQHIKGTDVKVKVKIKIERDVKRDCSIN
jgi:hypothetical protein